MFDFYPGLPYMGMCLGSIALATQVPEGSEEWQKWTQGSEDSPPDNH